MAIDQPTSDVTEEADVLSEQTNLAPEAPISHTRLAVKEALRQTAPVPHVFHDTQTKSNKANKWAELSQGLRRFDTGSFRGDQ